MAEIVQPGSETDSARPLVARKVSNRGTWLFAGAAGLAAILLFSALEARRADRDGSIGPRKVQDGAMIEPPPPLAVPQAAPGLASTMPNFAVYPAVVRPQFAAAPPANYPRYTGPPRVIPGQVDPRDPEGPTNPVFRAPQPIQQYQPPAAYQPTPPPAPVDTSGQRTQAVRFANPATTVPQGSVVQAVLETALDSTRDGAARAIVSRDVRGFDGTRVLIPRGSRLYGEYKGDVGSGENRAMIQWTRLMRPDGVVIRLDSPSADPLGRAGVKGKVNNHFWSRFGNALLQTTLNLGVSLAARSGSNGTVIYGLPGSVQNISGLDDKAKPTLTVAQGTAVSVFVARDLDFTDVSQ